jgi:hypothetical protein
VINKSKIIGFIFLFGPYTMFINVLPIEVETQPVIASCVLIFFFQNKYRKDQLYIFVLVLYVLFVGLFHIFFATGNLLTLILLIFGPLLYISSSGHEIVIGRKQYFIAHFILLSILVLQKFDTDLIKDIMHLILPRFYTGVSFTSGLATEPAYLAQQIIYLYLLGEFGYKNNIINISKNELHCLRYLLLFYLALTPSNSMFVLLILVLIPIMNLRLLFPFLITIASILLIYGSRINMLISGLISNLLNINLETLMHIDPSGSTRVYLNLIGYLISLEKYFGVGPGNYGYNWDIAFHNYNIQFLLNHPIIKNWYNVGTKSMSYTSQVASDIGFIFLILFFGFLCYSFMKARDSERKSIRNVLLFIFFFSSQISNPIPWFLLTFLNMRSNDQTLRRRCRQVRYPGNVQQPTN